MALAPIAPQTVVSTGWRVSVAISGGSPANGVQAVGDVIFVNTGHSYLTPAGMAAVLSHISTYVGALGPNLTKHHTVEVGISHGKYSAQNGDLATEQAAIFAILATAANVTGPAS